MKKKISNILCILIIGIVICTGCSSSDTEEVQGTTDTTEVQGTTDTTEVQGTTDMTEIQGTTDTEDIQELTDIEKMQDFIIEDSDKDVVSGLVLSVLSLEELRLARNEIYARHGLIFTSEDLVKYFEEKEWYEKTVDNVDEIELNYEEQVNVKLISEQERFKSEDISINASVLSIEELKIEDNQFILQAKEDSLCAYVEFTGSWDYLKTTGLAFDLASDCSWYMCSPLAFQEDYSDAIVSSEEEVMKILMQEVEAIKEAKEQDEPYDTSISIIIQIENQKIVCVYQVAA